MADLNEVKLIGRLTFDPELRRTTGGTAVSNLRLVTGRKYKGRDGELKEETLYVDVEVWDKLAENCCQYLRRGSQVFVNGELKLDSYEDKTTGKKVQKLKVTSREVQFLDSKPRDGGHSETPPERGPERHGERTPPPAPTSARQAMVYAADDEDGEIPF